MLGADDAGVRILRRRSEDAPIEAGLLRRLEPGKPIDGEVISLRRRRDMPFLFDVRAELDTRALRDAAGTTVADGDGNAAADDGGDGRSTSDGPAQVATAAYRSGWDAIWGSSPRGPRGDRSLN